MTPATDDEDRAKAAATQPTASHTPWPHSQAEAEVQDIVTALRGQGVVTLARLKEACWAAHWSDQGFHLALAAAVSSGQVNHLDGDLYEIPDPPPG